MRTSIQTALEQVLALLKRVPVIFKVQALGLVCAGLGAVVVATMVDAGRHEVVAFAIPAAERPVLAWNAERDAFAGKMSRAFGIRPVVAEEFSGWILEGARRQDLAPELLASLVLTESSFRKHVRSSNGAIGPAQVRDDYWSAFCGSDLTDPEQNIYCGAQILSHFQDSCGAVDCALQAYNIGPYNRDEVRWMQAGARYVDKIEGRLAQFENVPL